MRWRSLSSRATTIAVLVVLLSTSSLCRVSSLHISNRISSVVSPSPSFSPSSPSSSSPSTSPQPLSFDETTPVINSKDDSNTNKSTTIPTDSSTDDSYDKYNDLGITHTGKMSYWSVYSITNLIGSFLCTLLIYTIIYKIPNKISSDYLIMGLCTACCAFSYQCTIQCLINIILSKFAYGQAACYIEAMMHMSSMNSMWLFLTAMAFDQHRTIVHGVALTNKQALWICTGIWIWSLVGIGIFSISLPIFMAPSGLFCFFEFDSVVMYGFFFPSFTIATGAMLYYYGSIFLFNRRLLNDIRDSLQATQAAKFKIDEIRLATKLLLFIGAFLASWLLVVCAVLVFLATHGKEMYGLDGLGGVTGGIHTILVTLTYGWINPRVKYIMGEMLGLQCLFRKNDGTGNTNGGGGGGGRTRAATNTQNIHTLSVKSAQNGTAGISGVGDGGRSRVSTIDDGRIELLTKQNSPPASTNVGSLQNKEKEKHKHEEEEKHNNDHLGVSSSRRQASQTSLASLQKILVSSKTVTTKPSRHAFYHNTSSVAHLDSSPDSGENLSSSSLLLGVPSSASTSSFNTAAPASPSGSMLLIPHTPMSTSLLSPSSASSGGGSISIPYQPQQAEKDKLAIRYAMKLAGVRGGGGGGSSSSMRLSNPSSSMMDSSTPMMMTQQQPSSHSGAVVIHMPREDGAVDTEHPATSSSTLSSSSMLPPLSLLAPPQSNSVLSPSSIENYQPLPQNLSSSSCSSSSSSSASNSAPPSRTLTDELTASLPNRIDTPPQQRQLSE